jgi:hypothetical protein
MAMFMLVVTLIAAVPVGYYLLVRYRVMHPHSKMASLVTFSAQVHGVCQENEDGTSRQIAIRKCRGGEPLKLIPVYDPRSGRDAIKICRMSGEQLGYWSTEDDRLPNDLRAGKRFQVTVDEIYPFPQKRTNYGMQIRVEAL